ncbi:uncharacterized protein Dwil_GK16966 [Drosophila willistoni]|uniref:BED-type domain-containing protein n=1 Tax=Drosophila willistoni TaxID=7260 RepID=B4MLI0_DROWI|nr:uncharacterized protein LOC6639290 [Drosophila willistoni]EDW72836.1 uncharacterized protein Dwil_GK16966 [Drosophila willistoni]
MFYINVQEEEEKCTESQLDILLKISKGEYRLIKKKKRSSVWNVYREIARADGSKLKWRYYCVGCKRVMQSTGGSTSNLRIHKCHVRYLKQNGNGMAFDAAPPCPLTQKRSAGSSSSPIPAVVCSPSSSAVIENKDYYEIPMVDTTEYDDVEEDEDADDNLEEERIKDAAPQVINQQIALPTTTNTTSHARPLLQLLTDEENWSDADMVEVQLPIELDSATINEQMPPEETELEQEHEPHEAEGEHEHEHELLETEDEEPATVELQHNFDQDTINLPPQPYRGCTPFDSSALAEAESYARAWSHAFLKLTEEQKFYAKRSIDELLVLGRLEKLNISTVTALTTNL